MTYTVKQGDVLEVTRGYPDNYFDGLFCDPPYGLSFMGKGWDTFASEKIAKIDAAKTLRHSLDTSRKDIGTIASWEAGRYDQSRQGHLNFQEFMTTWAKEALRVLKPGTFGLVFGGTRTWHRLACALEDAGFEIRDTVIWLYGSGFPKSFDISKGIDKAAGKLGMQSQGFNQAGGKENYQPQDKSFRSDYGYQYTPATDPAKHWQGYGTALKPSWEPVLLIRKPLEPVTSKELRELTGWDFWHNPTFVTNTIKRRLKILKRYGVRLPSGWLEVKITKTSRKALHEKVESDVLFTVEALRQWRGNPTPSELLARVDVKRYRAWRTDTNTADALKWNCGGLNIDGSRIPTNGEQPRGSGGSVRYSATDHNWGFKGNEGNITPPQGRWPANLILDEDSAAMLDAQSGELPSSARPNSQGKIYNRNGIVFQLGLQIHNSLHGDSGGASRFFYCAKASRTERNAGLEGFEEKIAGGMQCRQDGSLDGKIVKARNHHPTVKPLDLCRYLAKLILPPERSQIGNDGSQKGNTRKLNVPFCGSGSEIIGALQAGWDEVDGIDIDPDYCKIAEARLTYWCKREREKIPFLASPFWAYYNTHSQGRGA